MGSHANARRHVVGAFPATLAASTWRVAFTGLWARAEKAHGTTRSRGGWRGSPSDAPPGVLIAGTPAPRITNGEAVQLVRAFRVAAGSAFSLWYQYAAVAYGWDPPSNDSLDASSPQADRAYQSDITVALWMELYRLAKQLDVDGVEAALALENDFSDAVFIASVRDNLAGDGADAQFKLPTGTCTDKRTGRQRWPKAPCDDNGEFRDPFTGARLACDKPGDCTPTMVDDPITAGLKSLFPVALVVVAIWFFSKPSRQPRRSRRYED